MQAPVERFYVPVFSRLSRPNKIELHATLPRPLLERHGHEFGAVIDGDRCWYAKPDDHLLEGLGNTSA